MFGNFPSTKIWIGFFLFLWFPLSLRAAPDEAYSVWQKWAAKSPEGAYPSWLKQKEPELYELGVPENDRKAFLGWEGSLQAGPKGFSITPFLIYNRKVWNSSKFSITRTYLNQGAPLPRIHWNSRELRLSIQAFVAGPPGKNVLYARYEIHNQSSLTQQGQLALAIRPLRLKCQQGDCFSRIYSWQYSESARAVLVDEVKKVFLSQGASKSGAVAFTKKDITPFLFQQKVPEIRTVKDENGFASGVLIFRYSLKEKRKAKLTLAIPLEENQDADPQKFSESLNETAAYWRKKLSLSKIQVHPQALEDLQQEELAALLVRRSGPGLYPNQEGKFWTDETLKSALALVQRGMRQESQEDLDEMANGIDPSGEVSAQINIQHQKVPPPLLLDAVREAPSEFKEYQNQGKIIFAWVRAARVWQDRKWLQNKMPKILNILEYLVRLRKERLTYWYDSVDPDRRRFLGILPPSFDHNSKSPELRHRYLDDLWALRGWKDGQKAGKFIDQEAKNYWMKMEERGLRRTLLNSMNLAAEEERMDFIPIYPDSAAYEPSIGMMSYWPLEEAKFLPADKIRKHLDIYEELFEKAKKNDPQNAFRLANLDAVQTFLRAGRPPAEEMKTHRRERAFEMLRYYLNHRPAAPPQGNVSLLKFFRSACVYESRGQLILGAGLLKEWIRPKSGLQVHLPTEYGDLSYSLEKTETGYHFRATGNAKPPQGFLFYLPEGNPVKRFLALPAEFDIND